MAREIIKRTATSTNQEDKAVVKRGRSTSLFLLLLSLYQCPIERNLWKSLPRSCLADFRGDRKPARRRQWPSTSALVPYPETAAVSHSLHLSPDPRERIVSRQRLWEGKGVSQATGGALLIPAARFRSQFSRALTRLPPTLFDPLSSFTVPLILSFPFAIAVPLPYRVDEIFFLSLSFSTFKAPWKLRGERKLRKYRRPLTDHRIACRKGVKLRKEDFASTQLWDPPDLKV